MKLWQIVAVVAAGVIYGELQPGKLTYAFGHATLYILLPALLFEGAWNLHFRAMKRHWRSIATLAVPGVALTAIVIAGALSVVRAPFGVALLTGAILSATDPIAVIAVFRRMRVPASLSTIVEGESLCNDAVAVVLYRAVLLTLSVPSLTAFALFSVTIASIASSIGGIAAGIAIAYATAMLLRRRCDSRVQLAGTLVCSYGAYFAAEAFHGSGIFATIASAIALRYYERSWITLTIVRNVYRVWDVAAIAANAIVFFLVGAALNVSEVVRYPAFVIATLAGVAVARVAVSVLLLPAGFPREWLDVVRIAGMRGALSLALALALPAAAPFRGAIVAATFAVTLATIGSSAVMVPRVVERAGGRR